MQIVMFRHLGDTKSVRCFEDNQSLSLRTRNVEEHGGCSLVRKRIDHCRLRVQRGRVKERHLTILWFNK